MSRQIPEVHPELQRIARKIPQRIFSSKNLWFWRCLDHLVWVPKKAEDILIKNIFIPRQADVGDEHDEDDESDEAQIRLRLYRPKSMVSPAPVMVWLHGGGYVLGKPEQDDPCCIQYARELGIVIVSVDYRCAPEHPFPSALEDGYSALKWVCSHAEQLGVDVNRIVIGGESAGGGLAAALVQFAQDRKEIQPIFQLLVYPMLDDRSSIRADIVDQGTLGWSQESNRFAWESYLGTVCGTAIVPPYAVPARREDLTDLPPCLDWRRDIGSVP